MTDESLDVTALAPRQGQWLDRLLRRAVLRRFERVERGRLVIDEGGTRHEFGAHGPRELTARIDVLDARCFRQLAGGGGLGAAEAFIRGYWTCEDLVSLVRIFCRNAALSADLEGGAGRLLNPVARLGHWWRRNTTAGSRRNIAAHYDLGNEFFALFLDSTLAYSCGIFRRAEGSLHEASRAKFDRICRKLDLQPDDHLLEIGTGWGGFALYAAQHYGCRVTTTTISRKQYAYTQQLIAEAGLADRVTVLCEDYRAVQGSYDKLVSIEMVEAVGHPYLETYFRACAQRLKPHGMMLLQAIIIPDQRYDSYRRSVDFIQRYVFPGGCLPSLGAICQQIGTATDLQLFHLEDITPHYAQTLAAWRQRFHTRLDEVRRLGFSDEFIRTWEYYFCYCEGGFRESAIRCVQTLLTKPACQRAPLLPELSA